MVLIKSVTSCCRGCRGPHRADCAGRASLLLESPSSIPLLYSKMCSTDKLFSQQNNENRDQTPAPDRPSQALAKPSTPISGQDHDATPPPGAGRRDYEIGTKQDHQSRQYRMIIRTRSSDSTSDCWPGRSRSRSAKGLITRKAELRPASFERPHIDTSLRNQRCWRFIAQAHHAASAYGWWPRRAHSVDVDQAASRLQAPSSGELNRFRTPIGGECLPPAAQLRSCALSRAACRVRWSRSGRLGADRAASA